MKINLFELEGVVSRLGDLALAGLRSRSLVRREGDFDRIGDFSLAILKTYLIKKEVKLLFSCLLRRLLCLLFGFLLLTPLGSFFPFVLHLADKGLKDSS